MQLFKTMIVLAAAATFGGAQAQDAADIAQATGAAKEWLSLADSEQYGASWTAAAPAFQSAVSQSDWEKALGAARKPLGALKSRTVKSATYASELPGAPKGDYVVIVYDSVFANRAGIETVTPMRGSDGKWKVSGYFVR